MLDSDRNSTERPKEGGDSIAGDNGSITKLLAGVVESIVEVYLGKGPPRLHWLGRLVNAWLGIVIFILVGVTQYLDQAAVDRLDFVSVNVKIILVLLLPVIVAVQIACGIKHGGPLRLFFIGMLVPALAFTIVKSALG